MVYQLTFSSVDQISSINCLILRNKFSHAIRSKLCVWLLKIMLQVIRSCIRSKVKNQSFSVKTLILTISLFGDLNTFLKELWSKLDKLMNMTSKCWYWSKILNFDCKLATIDFFNQYNWFSVIWAIDWAILRFKTWNLACVFLEVYNDQWLSFEALEVQLSLWKIKT